MSFADVAARCAAAALVVVAFAACTSPTPDAPSSAPAAVRATLPEPPASEFDPGHIVSDDSFYDSGAMTEDEIQSFLESTPCRADTDVKCLADYTQSTTTQPAVGGPHCAEYRGGIRERASRIIAKVAEACGVSPRTLLVLLQKEQSLLTRPTARGYERATGYGCPDTADCEQKYFGFFNASPVQIRNQATANLYNYTPYQPSAATLADPDTGDACSAFGNLNFWRIWHRWFGDPEAERLPAFFPPCSRLVGGHPCPPTLPSLPTAPPSAAATRR